ncbi:MAG: hypothetical protein K8F52_15670 [Candidatus Scalindua rubra]|uniref:Uncharacterized protein n=1 Tax=Candidatus Scalindua brodae TaxID=237368 RepID=A0A0B0EHY4_9BACT|nr:MAG: hypothetical protein SCABRO_02589 [Candidatus Scalindua brodae]MBZ0110091.1 hypothetical protein [Candidatus Scalindua rubra]
MLLREKVSGIIGIAVMILFSGGATAFSQYSLPVKEDHIEIERKSVDVKAIREKEERGLDFARKAIKLADHYPVMKTEVDMKNRELDGLVEKKTDLTKAIQRLQIGLRKKKAEFARSPQLLKVSTQQYTQKIKELEDELAEVEKQIPPLESELANVNIELQVEELGRNIMVVDDTGKFDVEFEEAVQERFNAGKGLLNTNSLSTPKFR